MAGNGSGGTAARPRRGVWQTDAAPGQVALVVYGARGERLVRVELAERLYSKSWVQWLERWLAKVDRSHVSIVRN